MIEKEVTPFEEVTIWEKFSVKKGEYQHNHIEQGWQTQLDAPLPKTQKQAKDWKGAKWKKQYGFLREGQVTVLGPDGVLPLFMKEK